MIAVPHTIDLDNPEFLQAYELLKNTTANVFLTGKAGTGKSTFLRYICDNLRKNYVVLAPTGVAAVNVGGVTIHSFFQMPMRPVPPDDPDYSVGSLRKSRKFSRRKRKLIQELDLIIIDEVSMVRPDMIDFIDRALRGIRNKRGLAFGGVQLLLVGDIFQLEPVVTSDTRPILAKYYADFFFFNALAYNSANLISIELKKIYRQTDTNFIELLDRVRLNKATRDDFDLLNSRVDRTASCFETEEEGSFGITLASRRDVVSAINKEKMESIDHEEVVYEGEIKDDFPEKILPTDLSLALKVDAQVMLIRNDKEKRWVNGTLAKIKELKPNEITIELEDGRIVAVEKETWENINYSYDEKARKVKEEVIGRFTQYPLKAAWALTIHNSQGLTFNKVNIDMEGGAFSAGQTYVALSRCRSIDGLSFVSPVRRCDVIVSKGASDFSQQFNDKEAAEKALREAEAGLLASKAIDSFVTGNYEDAIESLWRINVLTGALGRKSVRRLISGYLGEINVLKNKIDTLSDKLCILSKEFVELGDMCLAEGGDAEGAYLNYSKAYDVDSGNVAAMLGMARCHAILGENKKALIILDSVVKGKNGLSYDALLLKGDIQAKCGDMSSAVLNYMAAHKKSRGERLPIERIIQLYEDAGMEDEADRYRSYLDGKDFFVE